METFRDRSLVEALRKRLDLFYRINVVCLGLPALQDRKEDIPLLIRHFIQKMNILRGKAVMGITLPKINGRSKT